MSRVLCNTRANLTNIDGFSEKTAGVLYDEFGVRSFSQLYSLDKEKLLSLDGFKDKKADNLLSAIEKSKNVTLPAFIFSLGIDCVGKKTAKDLASALKNLDGLLSVTEDELVKMNDIGGITAASIVSYFKDERNKTEIEKLLALGIIVAEETETKTGVFSGEKIVLTGSLMSFTRSEAGRLIEKNGGEVQSAVTKTTTLVVAGDSAGSKLDKAKKLGITIIDEDEFRRRLKIT